MTSAARPKLAWRTATVTNTLAETATARTITLDIPDWVTPLPGQHVDIRLSAPDGYQATRSYSLSSGPCDPAQITVERVGDGEVSPYLVDIAETGDTFEIRGPLGGYFVWTPKPEPVLLVGGGSGIAPLRSMWRAAPDAAITTVLYSAQTLPRVIYAEELAGHDAATIHLTRERAPGFVHGRITHEHIRSALREHPDAEVFVCGPTAFVETITTEMKKLGSSMKNVRTERFG